MPRPAQSKIRSLPLPPSTFPLRSAFTLTELLIVIAIIAVLASLVTAAAVRAMHKAKQASISLELKQIGGSMDNFKNDFGAYPPNGMNPQPRNNPDVGTIARTVQNDFEGVFKKMFPKQRENPALIRALCGQNLSGNLNLDSGMTAAEAVYFWLGGFSDDDIYPISGPRGPSFLVINSDPSDEVLEDRNRKYDFDLARLRPVTEDGVFDEDNGRFLEYPDPKNSSQTRRINFWRYVAKGSEQPILYFDVSRHKPGPCIGPNAMPGRYDVWAANPESGAPPIYAIKELRKGVASANDSWNNVVFSNKSSCQILHCGLDDEWGDEFSIMGAISDSVSSADDLALLPEGPFVKETADTLANFLDGTLEDAQGKK